MARKISEIFADYQPINTKVEDLKSQLNNQLTLQSNLVREVKTGYGRGPFTFKGSTYVIRERKQHTLDKDGKKIPTGTTTCFLMRLGVQSINIDDEVNELTETGSES